MTHMLSLLTYSGKRQQENVDNNWTSDVHTHRRPPSYHSQLIPEDSPLQTIQRETLILDRFITLKVREDVFADKCLHLEGDDKFRDLAQPQARLEDLVRIYDIREGVVSIPGMALPSPLPSRTTTVNQMYSSSIASSSHFSFQPPNSPFHDSNAVTVALIHTPAPIPQVPPISNTPSTINHLVQMAFSQLSGN